MFVLTYFVRGFFGVKFYSWVNHNFYSNDNLLCCRIRTKKQKRLEAEEAEKKVIRIRGERNKRKLKKIMGRPMIPVGNDIVAAFG